MDEEKKNLPRKDEPDAAAPPAEDSAATSQSADDKLQSPVLSPELDVDQTAVYAAGLTHIDELDYERIIAETLSEHWGEEPGESTESAPTPAPDGDPYAGYEPDGDYSDDGAYPEDVDEPPEEDEEDADDVDDDPVHPTRKVRPKRKNGYGLFGIPHILSTAIWLVVVVVVGVTCGRLIWLCAADVLAFGREDSEVTITITSEDLLDFDNVVEKLYESGLIQYPNLFKLYAEFSNAEEEISAGTYVLNTIYDYHALVSRMSAGSSSRSTITVTIPEGYTCAQIFALLEENGVCTVEELEEYASTSEFASYDFLVDAPRGNANTLEGFLFPNTYDFYIGSTAREVYIRFLNEFDAELDEDLLAYLDTLNEDLSARWRANGYSEDYIAEHQMTLYDVIIVASMIEKESANSGENYYVSSVIYNRLVSPDYPYLQIDATIVYATGHTDLTAEDLALDSPYNTYLYAGLPPTPICNPGINAIMAAFSPAETDYYYYVLDPSTGEHHFSTTLDEHNAFIASLNEE
ncbi:MAG: endolytic transglycosylase MltG [Firmicutes bacterium]|nr:endolytic transglycosylase MltG [Bacillota bacterium]